jgi:hypothetical protein
MKQLIKRAVLPSSGPQRIVGGLRRGIRMEINFDRNTRLYLGLYEVEVDRHLRRILRPGISAFDVGAHIGYHALLFARRGRADVGAFECDPEHISVLRRNLSLNPDLEPYIRVIDQPAGNEPDQLHLDDYAYSPDGFVPDLIKVDVDGGELSVLQSSDRLLTEHRPSLIVETHSIELEKACGRFLADHGYRPVIVDQRRLLPDQRGGELNRWLVCE